MKSDVFEQLVKVVYDQMHDKRGTAEFVDIQFGFTRDEVELLIKTTVDRCITVMEAEMDAALANDNAELYATLVDTAFKIMDEFGIDELGDWDEEELLRSIEGWDSQDDK